MSPRPSPKEISRAIALLFSPDEVVEMRAPRTNRPGVLSGYFDDQPALRANGQSGSQDIVITDWRPHQKGTLCAFFSARLSSGLIFRHVALHQQGLARWIQLPSREWLNEQGTRQFAPLIQFRDPETAARFKQAILRSVDAYLAAHRAATPSEAHK
jgi:hypothetical protein